MPGKAREILLCWTMIVVTGLLAACGQPIKGSFFYGALGLGEQRIIVAVQNTGANMILSYDLGGRLQDVLADSTAANDVPKGIAPYDVFSMAVLFDGVDRIDRVSILHEAVPAVTNDANLTGTLYQMVLDQQRGRYYAIETNTIESFTMEGDRVGAPFIATTVGSCTLNTPRGMFMLADGTLAVINSGNGRLLIYNVSTTTPTCVTSNTALNGMTPVAVIQHSNGLLYAATQGNDRIYSFPADASGAGTVVWATDLTVVNNPTAMLELPDGSILVASDGTNSIERIATDGTRVGSASFIRDGFTGLVTQMLLMGGQ